MSTLTQLRKGKGKELGIVGRWGMNKATLEKAIKEAEAEKLAPTPKLRTIFPSQKPTPKPRTTFPSQKPTPKTRTIFPPPKPIPAPRTKPKTFVSSYKITLSTNKPPVPPSEKVVDPTPPKPTENHYLFDWFKNKMADAGDWFVKWMREGEDKEKAKKLVESLRKEETPPPPMMALLTFTCDPRMQ